MAATGGGSSGSAPNQGWIASVMAAPVSRAKLPDVLPLRFELLADFLGSGSDGVELVSRQAKRGR